MAWFKNWFNSPYYHLLYQNRDFAEAEKFINKLMDYLSLHKNAEIVDLGCGKGRHSVFLHKLGYSVTGLDLSEESIVHNQQFSTEPGELPYLRFSVHDMREPMPYTSLDAVLSLFTSFGYFEDYRDDLRVFQSVHNSLKMEGIFVLDFLNEQFVKNTLIPEDATERGDITFKIRKKIENNHVIKNIDFEDDGEKYTFQERVKLHSQAEIENFGLQSGFEKIKTFGTYDLAEFNLNSSSRCITIFRKVRS